MKIPPVAIPGELDFLVGIGQAFVFLHCNELINRESVTMVVLSTIYEN